MNIWQIIRAFMRFFHRKTETEETLLMKGGFDPKLHSVHNGLNPTGSLTVENGRITENVIRR